MTTEDPSNGFRPDTGVISAYRSPGGPGVRLDGGTTHSGAEVSAHFDSMLVKLTCYGHGFPNAVRRARRAIAEFRIRGVSTNLPFLAAVLSDPDFQAGPAVHQLHRRAPAAAVRAPAGRPRHPAAHLPGRDHGEQAERPPPGGRRAGGQAAGPRPEPRRRRTGPGSCWPSWGRRASRPGCASSGRSRSPTPRSATRTSRCWPPGCAPGTCWPWPRTWPGPPRSCCPWSAGAARPTTWRCGSWPRTRGTGWPRCARRCPTSAPRCCCAGATPSATRRTRPR